MTTVELKPQNRLRQLAHEIIDEVEDQIRAEHPSIDKLASQLEESRLLSKLRINN